MHSRRAVLHCVSHQVGVVGAHYGSYQAGVVVVHHGSHQAGVVVVHCGSHQAGAGAPDLVDPTNWVAAGAFGPCSC